MKILDTAQSQYLAHMDDNNFPACFRNSRQFEEWQAMESIAHTKPRALPCRDCLPEYQAEMAGEGRCAVSNILRLSRILDRAQPKDGYVTIPTHPVG